MKFLIFFLLLSYTSASFFTENPCGPIVSNFNASKFTGLWYKVLRTPNEYEEEFKCLTFEVTSINNHSLEFHESKFGMQNPIDATFHQHGKEGMFTVVEKEFKFVNVAYIFDADYENYVVAYTCGYDHNKGRKMMKYVWVDSKTVPLKDEVKNEIYRKLHKYMDVDRLKVVNHDKELCGY